MSWHCSQVLADLYLEGSSLDGEQFVLLKKTNMPETYLLPDKMTGPLDLFQYGMMSEHSTGDLGKELLTWFREDFLVPTSQPQEREKELRESSQVCGKKWQELSARYDRNMSLWRTHHCLLEEALHWSSVILPSWGMLQDGVLYQRRTAERPIKGTGYGYIPTPTSSAGVQGQAEYDGKRGQLWPTPTVCGNYNRKGASKNSGTGLATAVKMYPTPRCADGMTGKLRNMEGRNPRGRLEDVVAKEDGPGGVLNPEWVEWLMHWPIGWTSIEPISDREYEYWENSSASEWYDGECGAGNAIGRTIEPGRKVNANRIRCLGNGQVPAVVKKAWEILTEKI